MKTDNLRYKPYEMKYIGDAPNPGDMELIEKNLESALKIQEDYWRWKAKQRKILEVSRI